jgi:hypothetical protein
MSKNLIDINSEELYKIIKSRIKNQLSENKKKKKSSLNEYIYTQEEIYCSKKFISFDNNSDNEWSTASFGTDVNRKKILSPKILDTFSSCVLGPKRNGHDITNRIFCSNDVINYKIVNNNIKSTFILKGESDFWIFLHSKGKLEEGTAVILFSKNQFTETVFMYLGLFLKNDDLSPENDKKYFFRIFQTMQLVETYDRNNKDFIMNTKYEKCDSSLIKINVVDDGSETIKVSAWINEGDAENVLKGNFFTPVNMDDNNHENLKNSAFDIYTENYKIMFAGSGNSCEVIRFSCETDFKEDFDYFAGCNKGINGCNCCKII